MSKIAKKIQIATYNVALGGYPLDSADCEEMVDEMVTMLVEGLNKDLAYTPFSKEDIRALIESYI